MASIKTLDRKFSLLVRELAGWKCAKCGGRATDCSHHFGRGRLSTRFDLENCDALCRPCHSWFGEHPKEFREWKRKRLGDEAYDRLLRRSNRIAFRFDAEIVNLQIDMSRFLVEAMREYKILQVA